MTQMSKETTMTEKINNRWKLRFVNFDTASKVRGRLLNKPFNQKLLPTDIDGCKLWTIEI